MWQGTNMQAACPEGSMIGVINFFNVDNVAYGKGGMEEVVLEGQRVRTWIQAVVDHRSDEINVGGRVEQAFKTAYGRDAVRFVHSCPKKRSTQEEAGECSVIVMPEVRARAQKAVKDRRGWGRYAGVVLAGGWPRAVQLARDRPSWPGSMWRHRTADGERGRYHRYRYRSRQQPSTGGIWAWSKMGRGISMICWTG